VPIVRVEASDGEVVAMTTTERRIFEGIDLVELYPDGRTFYDETDDAAEFIKACHAFGLCPATNHPPPGNDLDDFVTVYVPAHKLVEFYELGLRVGT
jgi:hypothetical protein